MPAVSIFMVVVLEEDPILCCACCYGQVKVQKMRSNLEEKLMKKMAVVYRKAEEWRAAAQLQHSQETLKAAEQAQRMKALPLQGSSLGGHYRACGCIPLHPHQHHQHHHRHL